MIFKFPSKLYLVKRLWLMLYTWSCELFANYIPRTNFDEDHKIKKMTSHIRCICQ